MNGLPIGSVRLGLWVRCVYLFQYVQCNPLATRVVPLFFVINVNSTYNILGSRANNIHR